MKNYTAIHGSQDAGENGIYTLGYGRMVLSSRELSKLGVNLIRVIANDWSDSTIRDLIARNEERMVKARRKRDGRK